jgi:O-antigen/teichoic acid export membrane protein
MSESNEPLWKKYFWRNTASNYVRMITRLGLGLVLFRLLFSNLSEAQFGYWSLLWSLFGYGVLLDFGFGFTAQKVVAEKTTKGDLDGLNRLMATLLWTYVGLAGLLFLIFFAIRGPFMAGLDIPPEEMGSFTLAYFIFFAGLALNFPFGLFPEILRGLQRLYLANWLNAASSVLNFAGIATALWMDAPFTWIIGISVTTTLLPNIIAAIISMRLIPSFSLSPRLFEIGSVKAQLGFSMVAYCITFSNLLMGKSDQLVLGLTLGVAAITLYQASYKVAEMFGMFTIQLQEALSPAAASLHASGDNEGLRDLLLRTSRLTFLISTPLYLLCAFYLDPLIRLLTGMEEISPETFLCGQILLLAIYSSQMTNSCTKRILMMCGFEKKLLALSLTDAGANLIISIILAFQIGIIGVAMGTFIPTVIVGWLWVIPITLSYLGLNHWAFLRCIFKGTIIPVGTCLALLLLLRYFAPLAPDSGFIDLALRGGVVAVITAALGRKQLSLK